MKDIGSWCATLTPKFTHLSLTVIWSGPDKDDGVSAHVTRPLLNC